MITAELLLYYKTAYEDAKLAAENITRDYYEPRDLTSKELLAIIYHDILSRNHS